MSQESENFEQLRRLLKLKRYEQPSPRYFNDFSNQVIACIRLEQGRGHSAPVTEFLLREASRLRCFWTTFAAKPFATGGFGLAMSALLVTAVVYSEKSDIHSMTLVPGTASARFTSSEIASTVTADHPLGARRAVLEASSTDPVPAVPLDDRWWLARISSPPFPKWPFDGRSSPGSGQ